MSDSERAGIIKEFIFVLINKGNRLAYGNSVNFNYLLIAIQIKVKTNIKQ